MRPQHANAPSAPSARKLADDPSFFADRWADRGVRSGALSSARPAASARLGSQAMDTDMSRRLESGTRLCDTALPKCSARGVGVAFSPLLRTILRLQLSLSTTRATSLELPSISTTLRVTFELQSASLFMLLIPDSTPLFMR